MAVANLDGVKFSHGLSKTELDGARVRIKQANGVTGKYVHALHSAIAAKQKPNQELIRELLLEDDDVILASAIAANKKLSAKERRTLEECLSLPEHLKLDKKIDEPVIVWAKQKSGGGHRILHRFGLQHRTAQECVKRVMQAYFKPAPFQYTNLGYHAAIKAAKQLLCNGYKYVAHLDIQNFYGSFNEANLPLELPLPNRVVEKVVMSRQIDVQFRDGKGYTPHSPFTATLLKEARLGIPAGSVCSPIIGMYIVSRLKWQATSSVELVNLSDNFLLLAKHDDALPDAVEQLVAAIGNLPGGNFKLQSKYIGASEAGFDFLGHHLRLHNGMVAVSPTVANLDGFYKKLNGLDTSLGKATFPAGSKSTPIESLTVLANMYAAIQGWETAFKECDDIMRYTADGWYGVSEWCEKLGIPLAVVKAAVTPDMEYIPDPYQVAG